MAKVREDEKLDKATMQRVISLLEQEKPITKKAACEILNISYNTSRLGKLIEEFKKREANSKVQRAKRRGTPLSDQELSIIAQDYLNGVAVSNLADTLYRSAEVIKKAILGMNIPLRHAEASYQNPYFIEDDAISEEYSKDDLVYSARYQCPALIEKQHTSADGYIYTIYLLGNEQCYATQPYWELADLTDLQKRLGLKIKAHEGLQPSYNP